MNFAGKMWHCKDKQRVFYTPPSLLPPLNYDPRMSLTLFQDIGDNFPPEGVLDSLCLYNCGNIALLLFYRSLPRQNENYIISWVIKNLSRLLKECSRGLPHPPHVMLLFPSMLFLPYWEPNIQQWAQLPLQHTTI